jgi:hypothetical protein
MGFILGCVTYGLWNPFAAGPRRKCPLAGQRSAFAPEFGRHDSPREPEPNRHEDDAVPNRNTRCRSSRLTPRSRDGLRAGPTDTPGFSPAHLSCGRSTWCPVTVPSMGRPADPRRPTSQGRDNRRSGVLGCRSRFAARPLGWSDLNRLLEHASAPAPCQISIREPAASWDTTRRPHQAMGNSASAGRTCRSQPGGDLRLGQ